MDPTTSQYSDGSVPTHVSHHAGQLGTLPFTGYDLLALLAIVIFLVTTGIVLSRLTRA